MSRGQACRAVMVAVFAALVFLPAPVFADAAGPTDYLSEVVAVEPATPSIEVRVIGGDSFVELVVAPGTEVYVRGYQGEDYLWFTPDGDVLENRNSPTTYLNAERYGNTFPEFARAEAEPEWVVIGSSGRWAWHDHRAHWMQRSRPLAAGPGDQILEAVIPIVVDGDDVDVTVISTWQPAASTVPRWVGATLAVLAVGLASRASWASWASNASGASRADRRSAAVALTGTVTAAVALLIGAAQFLSLPSETGPRPVWWVLPLLAVVSGAVGIVASRRRATFVAVAACLLTGVELALWAWIRRDGLTAALIPTELPGWFDRFGTSAALVAGVGLTIVAAADLVRMLMVPSGALSASRAPSD